MIDEKIIEQCEEELQPLFKKIEKIALYNQQKVLSAFQKNKISLRHFYGTSGYGYDDEGRDVLNKLLADIFKAEKAICSPNIVSGTHALSLCLFGVLRPNDVVLSVTGEPYDTLSDVIKGDNIGSLADYGIKFHAIPLKNDFIDYDKVKEYLCSNTVKMVYLQRSKGYEWRDAFSVADIENIVKFVRACGFTGCIMLDNCYGEFVDEREASEVGVNLLAGSLIKNLGGGIAPTGGYVCGDGKYVDLVANRMTAPSIGGEVGSYAFGYREFYQGIFLAPHVVSQAIKGTALFGAVLTKLGFECSPKAGTKPNDVILSIKFNAKEPLISFIGCIQENSPVDSYVQVMPWDMPGYEDQVIMAAGCFVQGSSIELSADAPIKPPYIAYLQGGLTYEHCKLALLNMKL